jgi:hypothetical protein
MKLSITSLLFLLITTQICVAQNTGINTKNPKATLDINGDLIIEKIPLVGHNGDFSFYQLGYDNENRIVTKSKEIESFSIYLGFSPMAPTHTAKIPVKIEKGYITKITGTSIGACFGVKVDFELQFIDKKFISAVLQAYSLKESEPDTVYDRVVITNSLTFFTKSLETLAKATACSADSGHTLSLNTDDTLSVTFLDKPTYYPNSGIFVIYNVNKTKYIN